MYVFLRVPLKCQHYVAVRKRVVGRQYTLEVVVDFHFSVTSSEYMLSVACWIIKIKENHGIPDKYLLLNDNIKYINYLVICYSVQPLLYKSDNNLNDNHGIPRCFLVPSFIEICESCGCDTLWFLLPGFIYYNVSSINNAFPASVNKHPLLLLLIFYEYG